MSPNAALNTTQDVTAANGVMRVNGFWSGMGTGFNGVVRCSAIDAYGRVWFGGDFTTANGVTVNRICYWDGTTFQAIGGTGTEGCDAEVRALSIDSNGEDVIFAGDFANVAGAAKAGIAKYDFSAGTFSAYGSGLNGDAHALLMTRAGVLYVGGDFTTANGVTVNRLAYWNGSTFATMSEGGTIGMNGVVRCLAESAAGYIVAGGSFTTAGDDTVNYICYWKDSTHVYAIGDTPGVNSHVMCITITPADEWYIGGWFTQCDGETCNYVAKCDMNGFQTLTTGVNNAVYSIKYNPNDRLFWVGGLFTAIGTNTSAAYVATWSGTAWSHVDIDLPSAFYVTNMAFDGEKVYLGGEANGTATAAGSTTVTSTGTAGASPIFIVKRSGGTSAVVESIVNTTYNKRLTMRYALADGETITIDLFRRKVTSDVYGNIIGAIYADSNDATWLLEPGANVIAAFVSVAGAPTVTAYVRYENVYRSIDGAAA
jgi:trimeric autotransporter adhesin